MKKPIAAALLALGLATSGAQAQSTSGQFDVSITLTSSCVLSAVSELSFAYTSMQAGAASATGGGFSVTCTNGLPYDFGLQAGAGAATPPGASTIAVTDSAVNLAYTLGLSAAGGTGNGAAQSYSVTGSMAANQTGSCNAGTCSNASASNRTHTLIVSY